MTLILVFALGSLQLLRPAPPREAIVDCFDKDSGREALLTQLHLHGSLSEGVASMGHHTGEAERVGYDVLWWTDHMARQLASLYTHGMDFEGSLVEIRKNGLRNEFLVEEERPGSLRVSYSNFNPVTGSQLARVRVEADPATDWLEGKLLYHSAGNLQRTSLLAEPELRIQVRLLEKQGHAAFMLRLHLSARLDGLSPLGVANVLEYLPAGLDAPPPASNVQRVGLPGLSTNQWEPLIVRPAEDARRLFYEGDDQSLYKITLVLLARAEGSLAIDLDTFKLELLGPTDIDLYRAQESVLASRYSQNLTHHVGMETGGPYGKRQPIQSISTKDHLLGLYPSGIPELIDFHDPANQFARYPKNGVDLIHQAGGVAVIAHMFGARRPYALRHNRLAVFLASRLARNQAWGADAIEVGYPFRERELKDHVAAWDLLSSSRIYITGVASTDNHNVLPWDQLVNSWGSWLQATGRNAPSLLTAIRQGKVFFGDPAIFDPNGNLTFEASNQSYSMGNVVPAAIGPEELHARIDGASAGDQLVVIQNSREVHRETFHDRLLDTTFSVEVVPGDFLRISVHDPIDAPYLFSNPIYYIEEGTAPPPNRAPGS